MCLLITGAAGFIGQAVSRRLSTMPDIGPVRLVDRLLPPSIGGFESRKTDLSNKQRLDAILEGVTCVLHLASLPGGASEVDPRASRSINLEASLSLIEALSASEPGARFVYTSSIAVFGQLSPHGVVDDKTLPAPMLTYGTHKLMVEHAIADATRRGGIDGIAIRLPGVVARPPGNTTLKSAFLSEVFWAIRDGRPFEVPVPATATMWLLSIQACVDAILHTAFGSLAKTKKRAITLPALTVMMGDLVREIGAATGQSTSRIRYRPDEGITANFGSYPPLKTAAAHQMGFCHDGNLAKLVANSMQGRP